MKTYKKEALSLMKSSTAPREPNTWLMMMNRKAPILHAHTGTRQAYNVAYLNLIPERGRKMTIPKKHIPIVRTLPRLIIIARHSQFCFLSG